MFRYTWSYMVGCHVTLSATSSRVSPTITAHESAGAGLEQIFIDLKTDFSETGQISSSSESSESSRSSSISSSQSSWCHTCPRQNKQAECRPPYPLWQRSRHQEWRNPQSFCQLPSPIIQYKRSNIDIKIKENISNLDTHTEESITLHHLEH